MSGRRELSPAVFVALWVLFFVALWAVGWGAL